MMWLIWYDWYDIIRYAWYDLINSFKLASKKNSDLMVIKANTSYTLFVGDALIFSWFLREKTKI